MLSFKKLNFTLNDKKKLKFILYLFSFLFLSLITYLNIPKLLNFSENSLKESLKNNNININNISKLDYKIFPTPRLRIQDSNFTIGEDTLEVNNSEIDVILSVGQIYNFEQINYKKLIINKGSSKININNINKLLTSINKNKKKLIFRENNLIFLNKNKKFFEINNASIQIDYTNKKKKFSIDGNFLNNKIIIELNNRLKNKNSLTLEIPELDILTKVLFTTDQFGNINGLLNLEIFNNFLKFKFIKENKIKIKDGFIRSKLINSSIDGEVTFEPNFYTKLNFKLSELNMEKLFPLIEKNFFSKNTNNLNLIKKINGIFNFQSKFEGNIIFKNGEIELKDFKIGKNKSLYFNAKITEPSKKSKIQFNAVKTINYKKNLIKKIEFFGHLIPSINKVTFEKILLDGNTLSTEKIKDYEKIFDDEVIRKSLKNIFNENKLNKYFKNLI
tara:strand:- start:326 stop:1660 length:1335 start_codon:yes stop_codon:yes gene_type:complete